MVLHMAALQQVTSAHNLCARCLLRQQRTYLPRTPAEAPSKRLVKRSISSTRSSSLEQKEESSHETTLSDHKLNKTSEDNGDDPADKDQPGALSRKLAEMTEDAMVEGGRSARRNMQEAGFSEELKKKLEEKIKDSVFKSENAAAFSVVDMPSSAGEGTRDIAAASPWQGKESLHDAALRMLDDSKKPMRVPYKIPQPTPVAFKPPSPKPPKSTGHRLASARDGTSTYLLSQSQGLSEEEREAIRKELRHRFQPGARSLPMTIQGLTSLANERIEDAMARGQFKNIPRGKGKNVARDHNANSAFIDTTEYFMNKIIQKQEIVPPWIEKQQELIREIERFRSRLRHDWRRHAARLIASQGGSLQQQMRRAQAYAAAEARISPKTSNKVPPSSSFIPSEEAALASYTQIDHEGRLNTGTVSQDPGTAVESEAGQNTDTDLLSPSTTSPNSKAESATSTEPSAPPLPVVKPLRDPDYLAIERGYHELQIKTINDLTRSYNLQAPRPAHKPYLNLERELNACFAEVAPSLAQEIRRRATERVRNPDLGSAAATTVGNGMIDMLTSNQRVRVYDEDRSKGYGFKEFWRDLFGKKADAGNRAD